jgi:S-adenosylmethionine:tRNA ribosyltransferase-isomerase
MTGGEAVSSRPAWGAGPPRFVLPEALEAHEPPEARGVPRDGVRLLVARRGDGSLEHRRFAELGDVLVPGDLLVVNVSATVPAACPAVRKDGREVRVHVAGPAPRLGGEWRVVELRSPDGGRPVRPVAGERLALLGGDGGTLELVAPYAASRRLVLARHHGPEPLQDVLWRAGSPISYGYLRHPWPLSAYQNVYARVPGSAEMASAGRPLTERLLTELAARGVLIAPIVLHCGLSSPERHEPPFPERYEVPAPTARLVAATRGWGGRVIAVGTTVVRALETAAQPGASSRGWTNLVVAPGHDLRAVDGLITGWHEPEASHLRMLQAIAGDELLERSYSEALRRRYLWHEFGDSHLILP